MTYRTLSTAHLSGKRVLLRAGFDLPMKDGTVTDTTRVEALVPTMKHILDAGAVLVIMAHQGRPKDGPDPEFSQKPIVPVLQKLLRVPVHFVSDCIGPEAESAVAKAKKGEVVLLENLRFYKEEKKNDPEFARKLAALGDVYVNDAFTNCHRDHASMIGVPALIPGYMGLSLEQEVKHLSAVLNAPERPLTLVVSGAKMETKVPVIRRFLSSGDHILVGGCIANTLIAAEGHKVGSSKYDAEGMADAKDLLAQSGGVGSATIHVPVDAVVAAELSDNAQKESVPVDQIQEGSAIFDLGSQSIESYVEIIRSSRTIVWNGPLGVYEVAQFAESTKVLAAAVAKATENGATSLLGGGDTIDFLNAFNFPLSAYTFVSMGGGAMLEFISGKKFQSLELLKE
ncbi:MAG: phosphoglycerate kinase [Candidatus Peribacteraceae bacterium]